MSISVSFVDCDSMVGKLFLCVVLMASHVVQVMASEPRPGKSIVYELPSAGRVSLAVYDIEGRMVRTILTGKPRAAVVIRNTGMVWIAMAMRCP